MLKPETGAVLPLITALHPKFSHIIDAIVRVFAYSAKNILSWQKYRDGEPMLNGHLASVPDENPLTLECLFSQELKIDPKLFEVSHTPEGRNPR